ncbi:MAG: bifunctional methylenetetrahydrofolate dehydrogenase/methenyltetrahydrofolate cyclohydrolase FolD [Gammaproteobacteria bacterium WSBS_2016_MAG_OTU1]
MTAKVIDGRAAADLILADCAQQVAARPDKIPGLAVIVVGEDPASAVYVRNKVRACEKVGLHSRKYEMSADTDEETLLAKIAEMNADPSINGILVQLPLPKHIDGEKALTAILPEKDVDGFHPVNMGRLASGLPALRPCTPHGCMHLLTKTAGVDPVGKRAVIIGRSNIVGKPMALMLINAGATVTVCNSKTPELSAIAREADILVAAVGRAEMVGADMIKPGAVVIDVGINRQDKGLVGDVDYAAAAEIAGAITPVPGGVGPMTIAMLVSNTLQSAYR